jgi:hypothetical protein
VLLALVLIGRSVGCSCTPAASAPACEKLATAAVVFVGTVLAVEPDPEFPAATNFVYRFHVDMPYKGLAGNTAQVVVNPDNFTSSETQYLLGMRYLVFASPLAGTNQVLSGGVMARG